MTWVRQRAGMVASVIGLATILAVAALVVRPSGPEVIRLAAGAGGGDTLAVAETATGASRSDLMLWNPGQYRFELDGDAVAGPGDAEAWTLVLPSNLESAADELAERFGLELVSPGPYDDATLVAGSRDGTGPVLWVGTAGDWSYHAPGDGATWACVEPAVPEPPSDGEAVEPDSTAPDAPASDAPASDAPVSDAPASDAAEAIGDRPRDPPVECDPPTPPTGVPTETEARALADALFADLELPGEVTIDDVSADEWGARVQGSVVLDGVPTEVFVSASWGGDAELSSVASNLAAPVRAGPYPTIDTERAAERLVEQGVGWGRMPIGRAVPAPTLVPDVMPAPMPMPTEPATDLPVPDPDAELEMVTVTLVDVQPVLLLQWDVSGTAWLLPGYRFTDTEGGIWQVLAVDDEYLDTQGPGEPDSTEPDPAVPDPGTTPEPGDDGATGGGPDSDPGELAPGQPADGALPLTQELAEAAVGLTEEDAVEKITAAGGEVRVVARDGRGLPVTDDHRADRVNLHLEQGVVVDAEVG